MKPETENPDLAATKFISNINALNFDFEDNQHSRPPLFDVTFLGNKTRKIFISSASFDTDNRLHGIVELNFIGHEIIKFGFDLRGIVLLLGHFVHGELMGTAVIKLQDERIAFLTVKNGVLHGPAIIAGTVPLLPDRFRHILSSRAVAKDKIGFLGRFSNGNPFGTFWFHMLGGGFMHGNFQQFSGQATGDALSFIYPDMETAFHGTFENFVMKKAKEADIVSVQCHEGLVAVKEFSVKKNGPTFYYEPPTNQSFGAGPYGVVDPYERKWLKLSDSSVPNSGQGVFALKDIPANRSLSLYSGFLFREGEEMKLYSQACKDNVSRSDEERQHCKKYSLGLETFEAIIDIPPEFDQPDVFQPTFGPKVNHHFHLNNSIYTEMEHPRFGSIMSVFNRIPIEAGSEIFTFYGYSVAFTTDFPWYFEQLENIEKEEKKKKKKRKEGQ